MQAAQGAGRTNIVIVGFDTSRDAVKAVQEATMAATIAQLPDKIIQTAIDASLAHLAGETVKPEIGIELKPATKLANFNNSRGASTARRWSCLTRGPCPLRHKDSP